MINFKNQIHEIEDVTSNFWKHQFEESKKSFDDENRRLISYNLIRFFKKIDEKTLNELDIDSFYYEIISFIIQLKKEKRKTKINFDIIAAYIAISDFFRCFKKINGLISSGNQNEDLKLILASCLTYFGRCDDALKLLLDYKANFPELISDQQIRLAFIYLKKENYKMAKYTLQFFLENNMKHPFLTNDDINFHLAVCFLMLDEYENGVNSLIQLSSRIPIYTFFQIAYFYAKKGNFSKAFFYLNQINQDEHTFESSFLKAFILYNLGELSESFQILNTLDNTCNIYAPIHELLGLIYFKLKQYRRAAILLKSAYSLDQANPEFMFNYCLSLEIGEDSKEEAVRVLENVRDNSYYWEAAANKLAIFQFSPAIHNNPSSLIEEPDLTSLYIYSPAEQQIKRFFEVPPYLPQEFFSFLSNFPKEIPLSPQQRKVSFCQ